MRALKRAEDLPPVCGSKMRALGKERIFLLVFPSMFTPAQCCLPSVKLRKTLTNENSQSNNVIKEVIPENGNIRKAKEFFKT